MQFAPIELLEKRGGKCANCSEYLADDNVILVVHGTWVEFVHDVVATDQVEPDGESANYGL